MFQITLTYRQNQLATNYKIVNNLNDCASLIIRKNLICNNSLVAYTSKLFKMTRMDACQDKRKKDCLRSRCPLSILWRIKCETNVDVTRCLQTKDKTIFLVHARSTYRTANQTDDMNDACMTQF